MCSCVAKVTAPPPPAVTHRSRHTRRRASWLALNSPNDSSQTCVGCSSGWPGKQLYRCDKREIGKHTHLWRCRAAFTFCKRFTVPASDSLTATGPAATHRSGDKSLAVATSIQPLCSFLTAITQRRQVMKLSNTNLLMLLVNNVLEN